MIRKLVYPALAHTFLSLSIFFSANNLLAQGQYVLTRIVDSDTTELNGSTINAASSAPAIEGNYVVFRSLKQNSGIFDGIWAWHIPTKTFTNLANLSTSVPGGTGKFINFGVAGTSLGGPALRDGIVIFGGSDQGSNPNGAGPFGIYSVPVTGGAVEKIASFTTSVPDAPTNFFNFGEDSRNFGSTSTADGVVVFEGTFGGGPIGGTGVYNSSVFGGGVSVIGDSNTPWNPLSITPVKNFYNPVTNGLGVAMIGGTVFGNYGIFYTSLPSTGAPNFQLLVGPDTVLPGAKAPTGNTQVVHPSLQLSGNNLGFIARDPASDTLGVYTRLISSSSIKTIVTNKTKLTGITP
ncbi:MAG: hypothetical protein KDD53_11230, partial [Bdellovibrionales bacterium]|nr:hypothetical protein [Bdellovibrionales bacterium]